MKIAMILTNGFDPDPRVFKEAKSLVKIGHEVDILCWDRSSTYINKPEEVIDGIKIKRFFANAKYGSGYKQAFKFLEFKKDVLNYIKLYKFDVIHCHDFDGLVIGYLVNKKAKTKLIYDEHDLFNTYFSEREGFLNKIIAFSINLYEKFMLKKVDIHIVVTPKMVEMYREKSNKIFLVNNAPYKNLFNSIEKTESSKIRIGFIGSVRYYEEMLALVNASQPFKDKIDIIVSGKGIFLDKLKENTAKLSNVIITGAYSMVQLEELYRNIDYTYAFYPDLAAAISMPNKYFESIITETPIIANLNTEFGYEVNADKIGYGLIGENLEEEISKVLKDIVENPHSKDSMKENMRNIKSKCYWETNEAILAKIYNN